MCGQNIIAVRKCGRVFPYARSAGDAFSPHGSALVFQYCGRLPVSWHSGRRFAGHHKRRTVKNFASLCIFLLQAFCVCLFLNFCKSFSQHN
jgi:hypothetical protein